MRKIARKETRISFILPPGQLAPVSATVLLHNAVYTPGHVLRNSDTGIMFLCRNVGVASDIK